MFSSASFVPCVSVAVAWWYWPTGSCIADLEDTVGKLLALTASDSGALSGIPPVSSKSGPSQFTAAFASPAIRLLGYNLWHWGEVAGWGVDGLDCVLESSEDKLPSVSLCDDEKLSSVSHAIPWWCWLTGSCIADTADNLLALETCENWGLRGIPLFPGKTDTSWFTAIPWTPAIKLFGCNWPSWGEFAASVVTSCDGVVKSPEDKLASVPLCDDELLSSASSVPYFSNGVACWSWFTESCIAATGKILPSKAGENWWSYDILFSSKVCLSWSTPFSWSTIRLLGCNFWFSSSDDWEFATSGETIPGLVPPPQEFRLGPVSICNNVPLFFSSSIPYASDGVTCWNWFAVAKLCASGGENSAHEKLLFSKRFCPSR